MCTEKEMQLYLTSGREKKRARRMREEQAIYTHAYIHTCVCVCVCMCVCVCVEAYIEEDVFFLGGGRGTGEA